MLRESRVRLKKGNDGQSGQAVVELAISLLLFVTLLFGITETSRMGFTYLTVLAASREAARAGILRKSDLEITNIARSAAAGLDESKLTVSISPPIDQRTRGTPLTVALSYPLDIITPIMQSILGETVTVQGQTVMRME